MNPNKITVNKTGYNVLVQNIGSLLEQARQKVYYQINQTLVQTYWGVGKRIVEFEQKGKERAEYGSKLLINLSKDLSLKYGKGFSERNLERMRKFFLLFPISTAVPSKSSQKSQSVAGKFRDSITEID